MLELLKPFRVAFRTPNNQQLPSLIYWTPDGSLCKRATSIRCFNTKVEADRYLEQEADGVMVGPFYCAVGELRAMTEEAQQNVDRMNAYPTSLLEYD